jgi:hypothetical protein
MKKFSRLNLIVLSLGVVAATMFVFPAKRAVAAGPLAVKVVNTPLPVTAHSDDHALQPFTFTGGANWIGNAPNASFFLTVPAGKRLVIEQVAFEAEVAPTISQNVSLQLLTTVNGVSSPYFVTGTSIGPAGNFNDIVGAAQIHSYADPSGLQEILVHRADVSGGGSDLVLQVAVSGHLVNVP